MPRIRSQQTVEGVLVDWSVEQPLPGARLPVALLSRAQKAAELQRLVAQEAMTAAYKAELILGLADDTPELPDDHPAARRGSWSPDGELPGVAESFGNELSMILNCGRGTAAHLAKRAWTYRENLPATWAALAAGTLDEPRARDLADVLQYAAPAVARSIEAQLLPEATGLSRARLRKRAQQLLLERQPEAREKNRQDDDQHADVRTDPSHLEGMSRLSADLPTPESAACYAVVDQLARMLKADGDPRPIGRLRAAVLSLLIRRPWQSQPAVTAQLTVSTTLAALAGGGDAGEVNGLAISAAQLRELLRQLGALGLRAPEGGSLTLAISDDDGALLATVGLAELHRLVRRGEGLTPPPASSAYEPTDKQRAFVTTRDRTCRFPNCSQRVGWADLDHVVPHACGGETDCANLCCLCRSHHRLKTRDRNWRFVLDDDGTLHVTTPSGITRTTRPPGLRPPEPEPPGPDADGDEPSSEADRDPPPF